MYIVKEESRSWLLMIVAVIALVVIGGVVKRKGKMIEREMEYAGEEFQKL